MSNSKYVLWGGTVFAALVILVVYVYMDKSVAYNTQINSAVVVQSAAVAVDPAFPSVKLAKVSHGEEAIAALADKLPLVAQYYRMSADELKDHLRKDKDLKVDTVGKLHYTDSFVITAATIPGGTSVNSDGLLPLDQTFALHSRPGLNRVIYLDFTGHVTTGTNWNYSYGSTIVSAPFDIDGDPSTFSDSERMIIQQVWLRVAEDYLPFGVDVTTEEPSTTKVPGARIVISPTNWYNTGAGGTSYIGVFNSTTETPSFVFTQQLANNQLYIGEAVSHETGHALSLRHDGQGSSAYYYGAGGWAPIMGVGYYASISQWSKGDYYSPTNTQDDLADIGRFIPQVTDDLGNSISGAGNAAVVGNNLTASGIIERTGDIDFIKFNSGAGDVVLNVSVGPLGSNLDLEAALYDSSGRVLMSADPAGLPASINATLQGGTYYMSVKGVGARDPMVDGYTNYGSLGQFYISGTIVGTNDNPPIAQVSAVPTSGQTPLTVQFSSSGSMDPEGGPLSYSWDFGDNTSSTEANPMKVYNSLGTFTATLTVKDQTNLAGSKSIQISATNLPPVANFTTSASSNYVPLSVFFDGSSSADPDGTIVSYAWDFGDGMYASGVSTSHVYNKPGTYAAKLTVTDNSGLTGTKAVSIQAVDPYALTAPTSLTASAGGKTKGVVTLKWNDTTANETGFYIERAVSVRNGTPNYQRISQVSANTMTFVDSVTAGTYLYRVQSYNSELGKVSAYSNVAQVKSR